MIFKGISDLEQKQFIDFIYHQQIDALVYFTCQKKTDWNNLDSSDKKLSALAGKFRLREMNDSFSRLLGKDRENLIGVNFRSIFGKGFSQYEASWLSLIEQGQVLTEFTLVRPDKTFVWIEASLKLVSDTSGSTGGILGIFRDISKRQLALKKYDENEERIRKFAHLAFQAILFLKDARFTDVNEATTKLTGYSREEILQGALKSCLPKKVFQKLMAADFNETSDLIETTLITRGKKIITVEIEKQTIFYNGEEVCVIGMRDISNRKRIEEEIIKLSIALDQSANEIIITRKNGDIEYVNRAFSNVTGYLPSEVIGKNPRILKSGSHPPSFYKDLWSKLTKGEQWKGEFHNRKKNGELYWEAATITPIKNKESNIVRFIAIKEDVTMRKKAEDSLRESEEKFRSMLSNIPGVVYRCAPDSYWTVFFITDAIENLTGFNASDFLFNQARSFSGIIHPEDLQKVMETVNEEIARSQPFHVEYRIITRQNTIKWVSNSGRPVYNENQSIKWLDGFLFDITERVMVLEELKKAKSAAEEANNAKSEFLANISHEIRTPLNSVLGFTELLEGLTVDNTQIKYLNSIKASGKNLMILINDLLDLSKIEAGKMTIHYAFFDIRRLLDEIRNVFSLRVVIKGIGYYEELDKGFPAEIKFDETRLRQILINLVGNAIKFTHEGEIRIRIRALARKEVREQSRMKLEIKVIDTGIGIPDNSFRLIFESFRQHSQLNSRKYGGTGLGLAITKRLVEAMNGRISVESEVGKGSIFSVYFPSVEYSTQSTTPDLSEGHDDNPSGSKQLISSGRDRIIAYLSQETGNAISENDYAILKERLAEMEYQWKMFETKQPLKEIKAFAQNLCNLGKGFHLNFMAEYGEQLLSTIENFDIEEMRLKLDYFPDLLKQLKKTGHES